MIKNLSKEKYDIFLDFNNNLNLLQLDVFKVNFEKKHVGEISIDQKINITWGYAIADNDPLVITDDKEDRFIVRPKIDLNCELNGKIFYKHSTAYSLAFNIHSMDQFESIKNDKDLWTAFLDNNLMKTIWPFFRQQVFNGMNSLCLKPVTLPFIH